MKAIYYRDYGVHNLKVEELEKATPADNEVLISRSRFTTQKFVTYLAMLNKKDMTELAELMQSGKVKPVIDRT